MKLPSSQLELFLNQWRSLTHSSHHRHNCHRYTKITQNTQQLHSWVVVCINYLFTWAKWLSYLKLKDWHPCTDQSPLSSGAFLCYTLNTTPYNLYTHYAPVVSTICRFNCATCTSRHVILLRSSGSYATVLVNRSCWEQNDVYACDISIGPVGWETEMND